MSVSARPSVDHTSPGRNKCHRSVRTHRANRLILRRVLHRTLFHRGSIHNGHGFGSIPCDQGRNPSVGVGVRPHGRSGGRLVNIHLVPQGGVFITGPGGGQHNLTTDRIRDIRPQYGQGAAFGINATATAVDRIRIGDIFQCRINLRSVQCRAAEP